MECIFLAVFICLIALIFTLELWKSNLTIPFLYSGDSLFAEMQVKSIIDNGWYLHNQFLGTPAELYMNDYPQADIFHFL